MSKYISLQPSGLSDAFDIEIHGVQPVVTIDEKDTSIQVSFIFPGFSLSDVDQDVEGEIIPFKEVGVSGAGFISESGKPLLPSFGTFVQIPPGCSFETTVKKSKPLEIEDIVVTPAQEEAIDNEEGSFEYDHDSYTHEKHVL